MINQRNVSKLTEEALFSLATRPFKTAELVRNTILGTSDRGICVANPLLALKQENMNWIFSRVKDAIKEGRMIDFGFIPNDVIKTESIRARTMFEGGDFQPPFEDWVGVTAWEGGYNIYYVAHQTETKVENEILVVEMYGVQLDEHDMILYMDSVFIKLTDGKKGVIISPINAVDPRMEDEAECRRRGSNSLDPLVAMLRFLSDASIPVILHEAPVKLNKARAAKGKVLIPDHIQVETKDYVSKFMAANRAGCTKGPGLGGHHASPIAHYRRSHMRHLSNGKSIPVKSSKVNWRDINDLHRLFYKVKV